MTFVTLIYEASTPLMHVRKYLIQSRQANGPHFIILQLAFAATFFLSRIVFGFAESIAWAQHMLVLLTSGTAHSPPLIVVFLVLCAVSCSLNVYWAGLMIRATMGSQGSQTGLRKAVVQSKTV